MTHSFIKLIECPRDAMQGWNRNIPASQKVEYLQALLAVGFHSLDCLSFVSPKAIPQMADSHEVVQQLDLGNTGTRLLAIVLNERGANDASAYEQISYLGYPFSISPTFQLRNANSGMEENLRRLGSIANICNRAGKKLVVYLSMGFGNPYGDAFSEEIMLSWLKHVISFGPERTMLADTVGLATPEEVLAITQTAIETFPNSEIGAHLHSSATNWKQKMNAALKAGCTCFDGAIMGFGGCPMAGDDLIGNMDTLQMADYLKQSGVDTGLDFEQLGKAAAVAAGIFV